MKISIYTKQSSGSESKDMELVGLSKNGVEVRYDPVNSHAATHFEDTEQLKDLVKELIGTLELHGQEVATYYDMGRTVGTCDVVRVSEEDEIVYGMRKNRAEDGLVPFVKNRQGDGCPFVAVYLAPQPNKSYVLMSAWIGVYNEDDEPFPQSPRATARSVDLWSKRAFVYGSQEIVEGTETTQKPW